MFQLGSDVEIWGINRAHVFTHKNDSAGTLVERTKAKASNWFQLHPRDWPNPKKEVTGYFGRPKEHLDFLHNFEGTVWLQRADPDIPDGKPYPLAEIVAASGRQFFTSTFAYQLGLLWYQHTQLEMPVNRVYVYGVNLSSLDEYIHQKSCVEYWLGRLEEVGVQITIPDGSALLKGDLYAMGGSDASLSDHAFERLQFWKEKYVEAWANVTTAESMKTELKFWAAVLSKLAEDKQFEELFTDELKAVIQSTIDERMKTLNSLSERSGAELNGALGMVKDNQHWLAITGGFDHHAPKLPELRLPSPALSGDIKPAEPKSI